MAYEADKGLMVVETGLVMHPSIPGFGASPDGLVGDDGVLEIKCPNTATHIPEPTHIRIDDAQRWRKSNVGCSAIGPQRLDHDRQGLWSLDALR